MFHRANRFAALVLALVAAAAPAQKPDPKPADGTGSAMTDAEAKEFLDFHNTVRKEFGVGTVTWSKELAEFAQKWADRIATTGELEHRPADGEWVQKYGENLAVHATAVKGAEAWYAERKDYEKGTAIPEDLSQFKAGHYTQIVWKGTSKIGAGVAVVKKGKFKGLVVVVCNYDPPGNVIGEKPY
jgi:pathogenesis-related protein 1